MKFNLDELKTGDIILFNNNANNGFFGFFANAIKFGSHSNYTHIGMILKNPTFIHKSLQGIYVWESGIENINNNQIKTQLEKEIKKKIGVQITPIYEMINSYKENNGKIFIRRIHTELNQDDSNYPFSNNKLLEINNHIYDKPYDINPLHWLEKIINIPISKHTNSFWCSALIGYIYTTIGILDESTDWSNLSPSDFSIDGENLKFKGKNKLENIEIRI